ncbi:homoserine kinase [Virgibacillus proomii]|jgi:homoserine kinase|uniref:homoserine kinase n=1 Tax=Virgibacillus proomii TaxID=84407 RepID=UPI00098527E3|nr:homoserine kinase [Virgibacillus proomii]
MNSVIISVPASSANIGPGFDSLGLALDLYLTLTVTASEAWKIEQQSDLLPSFTSYEDHFIYQIAQETANRYGCQLPSCHLTVDSSIPLARGLGSSASAIIAGIELANQCCQLHLTTAEKLQLATIKEGHPDNVAAALIGGLVITAYTENKTIDYYKINNINADMIIFIPNEELKTEASRKALPEEYLRSQAANASSIANVFLAALISKDYDLAGKMMEKDLFHEPYRAKLIANYSDIKQKGKELGVYGTVISGAGPTMLSFAPKGQGKTIAAKLQAIFPDYLIQNRKIDMKGLEVTS